MADPFSGSSYDLNAAAPPRASRSTSSSGFFSPGKTEFFSPGRPLRTLASTAAARVPSPSRRGAAGAAVASSSVLPPRFSPYKTQRTTSSTLDKPPAPSFGFKSPLLAPTSSPTSARGVLSHEANPFAPSDRVGRRVGEEEEPAAQSRVRFRESPSKKVKQTATLVVSGEQRGRPAEQGVPMDWTSSNGGPPDSGSRERASPLPPPRAPRADSAPLFTFETGPWTEVLTAEGRTSLDALLGQLNLNGERLVKEMQAISDTADLDESLSKLFDGIQLHSLEGLRSDDWHGDNRDPGGQRQYTQSIILRLSWLPAGWTIFHALTQRVVRRTLRRLGRALFGWAATYGTAPLDQLSAYTFIQVAPADIPATLWQQMHPSIVPLPHQGWTYVRMLAFFSEPHLWVSLTAVGTNMLAIIAPPAPPAPPAGNIPPPPPPPPGGGGGGGGGGAPPPPPPPPPQGPPAPQPPPPPSSSTSGNSGPSSRPPPPSSSKSGSMSSSTSALASLPSFKRKMKSVDIAAPAPTPSPQRSLTLPGASASLTSFFDSVPVQGIPGDQSIVIFLAWTIGPKSTFEAMRWKASRLRELAVLARDDPAQLKKEARANEMYVVTELEKEGSRRVEGRKKASEAGQAYTPVDTATAHSGRNSSVIGRGSLQIPGFIKSQGTAKDPTVTQRRNYMCTFQGCTSEPFYNLTNLNRHADVVHYGLLFECSYKGCDKRFRSDSTLRDHVNVDHKNQWVECPRPDCNTRLRSANSLAAHERSHVKKESRQKRFPCLTEGCSKVYIYEKRLLNHCQDVEGHERGADYLSSGGPHPYWDETFSEDEDEEDEGEEDSDEE